MQPAYRGLWTHLGDAGNVVRGITNQRQKIHDSFRGDAELGFYSLDVIDHVLHAVTHADLRIHQLRQILVAADDHRFHPTGAGLAGERADHIVGFDVWHGQQRQSHCADDCVDLVNLRAQFIRHRRAVRLVSAVKSIAKGFSRRIKHHSKIRRVVFAHEPAQHVDDSINRAGGFAARVGEIGHGMKSPVQIRRSVNEYQLFRHGVWAGFRKALL